MSNKQEFLKHKNGLLIILAFILVCLITLSCCYLYLDWSKLRQKEAQLIQYRKSQGQIGRQKSLIVQQKENLKVVTQKWNLMQKNLAPDANNGLFLTKIGQKMAQEKIELLQCQPLKKIEKGDYVIVPWQIEIKGDYHDIIDLLNYLEEKEESATITHIKLSANEQEENTLTEDGKISNVQAVFTLAIFAQSVNKPMMIDAGKKKLGIEKDECANPFLSILNNE